MTTRTTLRGGVLAAFLVGASALLYAQGGSFGAQIENFWRTISTGGRTFASLKATNLTVSGTCTGCGGGGGTPGGADTQVQFNDANVFAGNAGFTFTKGTNTGLVGLSGIGAGSFDNLTSLLDLLAHNTGKNMWSITLRDDVDPTRFSAIGVGSGVGSTGDLYINADETTSGGALSWIAAQAEWRFSGVISTGWATPSVANVGANSCGTTTATIAGNDNAGTITVGGTSGSQCRVTFTTTAANRRECTVTDETTTIATRAAYVDTTHTDFLGVFGAGDLVSYVCFAR